MSYTILTHKDVKARKEHECSWCGEKILVGEVHQYRSYIFDRDFHSDREHNECTKAMDTINWTDDEGYEPYTFKRGTTESRY
jgi:hypothetical protein